MKFRTTSFTLLFILFSLHVVQAASSNPVVIKQAWVREAPPNAQVLAAYLILENPSNKTQSLIAVHADGFKSAEIHRTVEKDGMSSMIKQERIDVPAHGTVNFETSGLHVMLMMPKTRLLAGNHVALQLEFANHEKVSVKAEVRKASGNEHDMMHHDHSMPMDQQHEHMMDNDHDKMHHDADKHMDMNQHQH